MTEADTAVTEAACDQLATGGEVEIAYRRDGCSYEWISPWLSVGDARTLFGLLTDPDEFAIEEATCRTTLVRQFGRKPAGEAPKR